MSPPPPDLLLTHAGALRSMARALLRDEHAADDVVQDTWLRALVASPSADRGLGGWLQRVAHGFVQKHRRSEGRRVERERRYAAERHEALDTEQRGTVLRVVFEAVLALDEPYRETVLLRWFEGLPPREVAQRLGVRVATVDSRLQRAHAQLRVRLERELGGERGGWRGAVALALGVPRDAAAWPTIVLPLIGVAVGLKLAVAGVVVLVSLCLWLGLGRSTADPVEPTPFVAAEATEEAEVALTAAEETHRRELASNTDVDGEPISSMPIANSARLGPGPFEFELRVEVVDASERPQAGAEVFLGPYSCSTARIGETGWDGVLTKKWRGFEPEFRGSLFVRSGGQSSSLRRVLLRGGVPTTLQFGLDQSGPARAFLLTKTVDSLSVSFGAISLASSAEDSFAIDAAGNGIFSDSKFAIELNPDATSSIGPHLQFDEPGGFNAIVSNSFQPFNIDIVTEARAAAIAASIEPPLPATVRGVVRDEHGRPLTGLIVSGRTPHGWNTGVTCNADGEFVFPPVPAGTAEFLVGGRERNVARERVVLAPGETRYIVFEPALRPVLRVRLTDSRERPMAAWRIEARSALDGSPMGVATTGDDGIARIGIDGSDRMLLFARPAENSGDPMIPLGSGDFVGDSQLELRVRDEMRRGTIELTIDDPFAGTVEARAWRVDSDEGMALEDLAVHVVSVPGRHKLTPRFLPGRWRVEARAVGRAWTSIGECHVEPGGAFDFGLVTLPQLAELELRAREGHPASARVGLRASIDGAIVTWAERDVTLPTRVQTRSDAALEILLGDAGGDQGENSMHLADPQPTFLQLGSPRVVEFP